MWRHVSHSLQGPSHAAENLPCQDSHAVQLLGDDESQSLIACAADGAGSAKYSELGSALVCEAIVKSATQFRSALGSFHTLTLDDILAWCDKAREKLQVTAQQRNLHLRDLATTLCAAIVSPEGSFFFQIGDGAITVGSRGVYGVIFWPQSGEYANATNFITSDLYREHLEFQATTCRFTEVALFTDGIERLALNFEAQTPHLPFFQPLFKAVRGAREPSNLDRDLRHFLESDSVKNRSDDDKTLILATRVAATVDGASDAVD